MTILVTTPRGKVGSELVPLLRERGVRFRLGARAIDDARAAFPGIEAVRFDYADPASFDAALSGVSSVYLAAPSEVGGEHEKQFIDAARTAGVKKIVKLSAAFAGNGRPSALRDIERHIEASGVAWTHLRPAWFDQNYATSQAAAIRGGTLAEPAGSAKTAFIDTRDIAAVAVEALTSERHDGKAYVLTGPEALDRNEVAAIISSEIGRTVRYVSLSDEHFRDAVKAFLPPHYVDLLSALYADVREGATATVTNDVPTILGRPATRFSDFARRSRDAWR